MHELRLGQRLQGTDRLQCKLRSFLFKEWPKVGQLAIHGEKGNPIVPCHSVDLAHRDRVFLKLLRSARSFSLHSFITISLVLSSLPSSRAPSQNRIRPQQQTPQKTPREHREKVPQVKRHDREHPASH